MDYVNETYKAVVIMDEISLYNFAENLQYKDYLYNFNYRKLSGLKETIIIKPNVVKPKWVWRREKTSLTYTSLQWGNVLQTIKSNYWGRKITLFYNRMKVIVH